MIQNNQGILHAFYYYTRYRDSFAAGPYRLAPALWCTLVACLVLLPVVGSAFVLGEVTYVFILCIAALGLMLLTGYTGQVSWGMPPS